MDVLNKLYTVKPLPNLSIILACDKVGTIGFGDKLPWDRIEGDLPRFKELTRNKTIVMGRKTLDSLPGPLPYRYHLIMSRFWTTEDLIYMHKNFDKSKATGFDLVSSIKELLYEIKAEPEEVFIIGGADICNQLLPYVSTVYLTRIPVEVSGDVKLPWLSLKKQSEFLKQFNINKLITTKDETFSYNQFIVYKRKYRLALYHRIKNYILSLVKKVKTYVE